MTHFLAVNQAGDRRHGQPVSCQGELVALQHSVEFMGPSRRAHDISVERCRKCGVILVWCRRAESDAGDWTLLNPGADAYLMTTQGRVEFSRMAMEPLYAD